MTELATVLLEALHAHERGEAGRVEVLLLEAEELEREVLA